MIKNQLEIKLKLKKNHHSKRKIKKTKLLVGKIMAKRLKMPLIRINQKEIMAWKFRAK